MNCNRRQLLERVLLGAGVMSAMARSEAAAPVMLDENEPAAKALGYDGHQTCANCALIAFSTAIRRPCSIFPGKLVYPGGWCKAWVKRGK